jgi:hypothetical protein
MPEYVCAAHSQRAVLCPLAKCSALLTAGLAATPAALPVWGTGCAKGVSLPYSPYCLSLCAKLGPLHDPHCIQGVPHASVACLQALDSLLGDFSGALQQAGGFPLCWTSDFYYFDHGRSFIRGETDLRWGRSAL